MGDCENCIAPTQKRAPSTGQLWWVLCSQQSDSVCIPLLYGTVSHVNFQRTVYTASLAKLIYNPSNLATLIPINASNKLPQNAVMRLLNTQTHKAQGIFQQ